MRSRPRHPARRTSHVRDRAGAFSGPAAAGWVALIVCAATIGCSSRHDPASTSRVDGATNRPREPERVGQGDTRASDTRATDTSAPSAPPGPDDAGAARPALAASLPVVGLPVAGFGDATVSLPRGTRIRRPIVLAVHGNYDSPEFQCRTWRQIVGDRAFVLCPRGVARRDSPGPHDIRYTFEGKLGAELDAALAALHEQYGEWIDPGPMTYLGFSLGAILARGYVMRDPARFDRLVLIEGGATGWNAKALAKAGAVRTLWACGQPSCASVGGTAAKAFERAGVPSKVVSGKGAGHTYGGHVATAIEAEWEWLVADDPRWVP